MLLEILKSKLHNGTIKEANLLYTGSITISTDLMKAANMIPNEKVDIYNITNGARLATYIIPDPDTKGNLGINGAAARLVQPGDKVIVCSYAMMDEPEAVAWKPVIVLLDENNGIKQIK